MKIKTKSIIKKRFRITKNNKVIHKIKGVNHFMSKKASGSRNRVKKNQILSKNAAAKIIKVLK
jgi:ribosomal protein L35